MYIGGGLITLIVVILLLLSIGFASDSRAQADSGQVAAEQGENKLLAAQLRGELEEIERAIADIARLMEQAGQGRSRYVRLADRAARWYARPGPSVESAFEARAAGATAAIESTGIGRAGDQLRTNLGRSPGDQLGRELRAQRRLDVRQFSPLRRRGQPGVHRTAPDAFTRAAFHGAGLHRLRFRSTGGVPVRAGRGACARATDRRQ